MLLAECLAGILINLHCLVVKPVLHHGVGDVNIPGFLFRIIRQNRFPNTHRLRRVAAFVINVPQVGPEPRVVAVAQVDLRFNNYHQLIELFQSQHISLDTFIVELVPGNEVIKAAINPQSVVVTTAPFQILRSPQAAFV